MRDARDIAERLRRHLVHGARITGVERLSGGHSNDTFLVEGIDRVLRMPAVGTSLLAGRALDIQQQFDLFAILRGRPGAPPVPQLDYMCRDEAVLGAPFFLMERIAGEAPPDWGPGEWLERASSDVRSGVSRQFVAAMTELQSIGPLDMLGRPLTGPEELERWRPMLAGADDPAFDTLFRELIAEAPAEYAPAVIHGDYKFANTLWRDDRLVAVLDWELAINADPRWGLAYVTIQYAGPAGPSLTGLDLPGLWQRDRIIAEWEGSSGLPSVAIGWFEAAVCAKSAALLHRGHELWRSGDSRDSRFEQWGSTAALFRERGSRYLSHFLETKP